MQKRATLAMNASAPRIQLLDPRRDERAIFQNALLVA
jgi:hypothetical protein